MSNFWDILLLAIILWILFIAGAFIYYRIIKPTKSGRVSRMEEKIEDSVKFEIATQGKSEND